MTFSRGPLSIRYLPNLDQLAADSGGNDRIPRPGHVTLPPGVAGIAGTDPAAGMPARPPHLGRTQTQAGRPDQDMFKDIVIVAENS
jgi:hypothetical protein